MDKSLDDGAAQALPDVHVSDKTLSCADVLREASGPLPNLHDKAPIPSGGSEAHEKESACSCAAEPVMLL